MADRTHTSPVPLLAMALSAERLTVPSGTQGPPHISLGKFDRNEPRQNSFRHDNPAHTPQGPF